MNDRDNAGNHPSPTAVTSANGINLVLVYSLIAVALLGAIIIALLIVLPFYHRR